MSLEKRYWMIEVVCKKCKTIRGSAEDFKFITSCPICGGKIEGHKYLGTTIQKYEFVRIGYESGRRVENQKQSRGGDINGMGFGRVTEEKV